jgi:hypothetical protein
MSYAWLGDAQSLLVGPARTGGGGRRSWPAPSRSRAALWRVAGHLRWLFKRRSGLSLASKEYRRGFAAQFGNPENLATLSAQLAAYPDERLIDHCQRWQERTGKAVSVATLHRARRALGWTHKKKGWWLANATSKNARLGAKNTPR